VWLNTATGIYHLRGMRWYGNTTSGAFVCEREADRAGYRSSVFCRYCEPIKVEGDRRSPAGIYAIGRPFGFAQSQLAGYLRLQPDSVCVEDPSSPAYNTITSRRVSGQAADVQTMGTIARFRRGLIVDYPTDAANRAGSCIFIHIQKKDLTSGTAGCLNLPEDRVAALQKFANKHPTALALLPESALGRLSDCLPSAAAESH
jgi:L,D-peptidoglycan transpeptidase YkuD (ErfK/YbiS/YcfS/YnhG family)